MRLLYCLIFNVIFSLILIVKPELIFKLNELGKHRIIFADAEFFSSPKASGILFIFVGIIIIYIGFIFRNISTVINF
jgi:hypothetical protein